MWKYWFHYLLSNTVLKWVILQFFLDTSWVFQLWLLYKIEKRWGEVGQIFLSWQSLSWQKFCCNKHAFVTTKDVFCHNKRVCHSKSKLVVTKLLLQQNYFCHDEKNCLSFQSFVMTSIFCHDKRCVLSRQTHVCLNKHVFVVTKVLSQQKFYLWQLLPTIVTSVCHVACHVTCSCTDR